MKALPSAVLSAARLAVATAALTLLAGCGHKEQAAAPVAVMPAPPAAAAPAAYAAPAASGGADATAQHYQQMMQQHPGTQPGARTAPATNR